MIKQDPGLMAQFLPLFVDKQVPLTVQGRSSINWQEQDFREFLHRTFTTPSRGRNAQRTLIFVDALDECDESQVRDIVYYFRRLTDDAFAAGSDLSVCLSSRYYPTITVDRCPEIEVENENRQDIASFLSVKLQSISLYETEEIDQLLKQLLDKSDGIFLWAVLVSELVLRDLEDGKPAYEIQETIRNVPEELGALFANILSTVKVRERRTSVILVQWVLLAQRTLSGVEVYHAIALSSNSSDFVQNFNAQFWKEVGQYRQTERITRFVRSYSRGLVEIRHNMVQFIHESVREFFLCEAGLDYLNLALGSNVLGDGHCTIIRACVNAITAAPILDQAAILATPYTANKDWVLQYAEHCLTEHAAQAKQFGAPHRLVQLATEISWRLRRLPELTQISKYGATSLSSSSRYLMTCHLEHLSAVCLYWCTKSVEKIQASFRSKEPLNKDRLEAIISKVNGMWQPLFPEEPIYIAYRPRVRIGGTTSPEFALETIMRGIDLNQTEVGQDTLLHRAIESHMPDLVSWLLSNGANADTTNDRLRTPLHQAALYAEADVVADIVDVLIKHGVNILAEDEEGNTALHLAIEKPTGFEKVWVAQALIQAGSPVNAQNRSGKTPLHIAVEVSATRTLKYLIRVGGDFTIQDNNKISVFDYCRFVGPEMSRNPLFLMADPRAFWSGASTNPEKMMSSREGGENGYLESTLEKMSARAREQDTCSENSEKSAISDPYQDPTQLTTLVL